MKNRKTMKLSLFFVPFMSIGFLASCGGKGGNSSSSIFSSSDDSVKVNVTYHFLNETVVDQVKVGETISLKDPLKYDTHYFYNYYTDEGCRSLANETYVIQSDMEFYALYCENDSFFVNYHDVNGDTEVGFYRDMAKTNTPYKLLNEVFEKEDYYIIQFGRTNKGSAKALNARDTINVTDHMDLYAIWNKAYKGEINGETYVVKVYPGTVGLGSAVLTVDGKSKDGFYNEETGDFEFYFGKDDEYSFDEDIEGKITGEGAFVSCDKATKGMYILEDYLFDTYDPYTILYLDGYGQGILGEFDGQGFQTESYGTYEYDEIYEDYKFTVIDPVTQKVTDEFYFVINQMNRDKDEANGTFKICGNESGSFYLYEGDDYDEEYALLLDGYGAATYCTGYNAEINDYTNKVDGKYIATSKYESLSGEYIFTSDDGKTSFKFCIYYLELSDNSLVSAFVLFNEEYEGTYYRADNEEFPCLYLDGYLGAAYYIDQDNILLGSYIYKGDQVMCLLFDYENNSTTLQFTIDTTTKRYAIKSNGLVILNNEVVKYEGVNKIVEIPEGITAIKDDAFNYLHTFVEVEEIYLPSSIQTIGARAFENNGSLRAVHFSGNVPPTIDETSFRWPGGQFKIIVPDEAVEAYREAPVFKDKYLNYIFSVEEANAKPVFEVEGDALVRYNPKKDEVVKDIIIPDEVKTIGANVFKNLSDVETVDLNNVETIGDNAFLECVNLKSIDAENVKYVGSAAFLGCELLDDVNLPAIETIGDNAFSGCYKLDNVVLGSDLKSIGDQAFSECAINVRYEGEDEIMESSTFFITLTGEVPPSIGSRVFFGTSPKIVLNSMSTAVNYYNEGSNWATYLKHLFIESGEEKGEYVNTENLLGMKVDGRLEIYDFDVYFYQIDGNTLTLYYLDDGILYYIQNQFYSDTEGFKIDDNHFVKKGTVLTYRFDEEVLVVNTNFTRDEAYNYVYDATFKDRAVKLIAKNGSIKTTLGDYEYSFTLNDNGTFFYTTRSLVIVKNYTAADGSSIQVTFSNSLTKITGMLQGITTSNGTRLSTEVGWYATKVSENVYKVNTSYLSTNYSIEFTLGENTFTYTYETLTKINCRTPENNFIVVSVNPQQQVRNVQIMFRLADNTLVTADSTYTEENGYYLVTVNFNEEVIDPNTGSISRIPSPRNGTYKVTFNLTARTGTMEKLA